MVGTPLVVAPVIALMSALRIPPPDAVPPFPAAVLWFTLDQLMVIVPWLTMPAPLVVVAVLLSTWLALRTALPPLAMPPAAIGGPCPGAGTGAVDVLPSTWLRLSTSWLVPGGAPPEAPPLPLPLEMPPPLSEVLPSTWLALRVTSPARFWMPPPPARGAVLLSTWLKLSVSELVGPEPPV